MRSSNVHLEIVITALTRLVIKDFNYVNQGNTSNRSCRLGKVFAWIEQGFIVFPTENADLKRI